MIKNLSSVSFTGTLIGSDNMLEKFKKKDWDNPDNCVKIITEAKEYAEKLPEGDTVKFIFGHPPSDSLGISATFKYIPGEASKKIGMRKMRFFVDAPWDSALKDTLNKFKGVINCEFRDNIKERDKARYI